MINFAGKNNRKTIVGIGSALVDVLTKEEDEFVERLGVEKGGMNLIGGHMIDKLIARATPPPSVVPGGSACNTVIGVGNLGGKARFVGKIGKDASADLFIRDLINNNVETLLFSSDLPTGRVLSVITPDAQRSMFTYLGAAAEMRPEEIKIDSFTDAAIVHVEGYLLFNRDLVMAIMESAKSAGAIICLDLASFNVVEESKQFLKENVIESIDILLANEDEARVYTGYADEETSLSALSENVEIAVLKQGGRGSMIANNGCKIKIQSMGSGMATDTTGAGDLWASGFLYGLVNGYSFEKSGELASACGYEVCQVIGANIPEEGWNRIRKLL